MERHKDSTIVIVIVICEMKIVQVHMSSNVGGCCRRKLENSACLHVCACAVIPCEGFVTGEGVQAVYMQSSHVRGRGR